MRGTFAYISLLLLPAVARSWPRNALDKIDIEPVQIGADLSTEHAAASEDWVTENVFFDAETNEYYEQGSIYDMDNATASEHGIAVKRDLDPHAMPNLDEIVQEHTRPDKIYSFCQKRHYQGPPEMDQTRGCSELYTPAMFGSLKAPVDVTLWRMMNETVGNAQRFNMKPRAYCLQVPYGTKNKLCVTWSKYRTEALDQAQIAQLVEWATFCSIIGKSSKQAIEPHHHGWDRFHQLYVCVSKIPKGCNASEQPPCLSSTMPWEEWKSPMELGFDLWPAGEDPSSKAAS